MQESQDSFDLLNDDAVIIFRDTLKLQRRTLSLSVSEDEMTLVNNIAFVEQSQISLSSSVSSNQKSFPLKPYNLNALQTAAGCVILSYIFTSFS